MPTPPPDYGKAAPAPSSSSSGPNPADIWGLGQWYGKPVVPVYSSTPGVEVDPTTGRPIHTNLPTPEPGSPQTTQDLMSEINDLWAKQDQENGKSPGQPTSYEQIQQLLWQAGFYGQTALKDIHLGQWTKQTQDAVKAAIQSYEAAAIHAASNLGTDAEGNPIAITGQQLASGGVPTFFDFLAQNSQASQNAKAGFYAPGSSGNTTKAPPQVNLTDPTAIRDAAQTAAMSALGHGLSEDQMAAFVNRFQEEQRKAQLSTASSVSTPDLSAQADMFAQTEDPADFSSYQDDKYMNALMNMFLPAASSRPNLGQVTPRLE